MSEAADMAAAWVRPPSGRRPPSDHRPHIVICNWRDSGHPQAGGAEQYCEQVARELARAGLRVTLATSRSRGASRVERRPFGTVVRLGGTFTTYPLVLAWLWWHRRAIDGVLDSENGIPYFSPLAVGRRTAVVLLIHHVHQAQFGQYLPAPAAAVGRWLERRGAAWVYGRRPVCVVSPSARDEVRRQLAFRGPILVAANGLDGVRSVPEAPRRATPTLVAVGRLVPHKRLELLLEVVADLRGEVPDLSVDVVGDGPQRPALEERARALGVADMVRFRGRVPDAERDRLIGQAWLMVNPTAGEGWGLSVLEAAALGVPTAAVRVPGMVDSVVHGDTGWLAPSADGLAVTVREALGVLADPAEAARWARRCRRWAATFTWAATAERIRAVLVGERQRLRRGYDERRRRNDAAVVVDLAPVVEARMLRSLRRSDQVRVGADGVALLLAGADELDAGQALRRVGVEPDAVRSVQVARRHDLLGWEPLHVAAGAATPLAEGTEVGTAEPGDRRSGPGDRRSGRGDRRSDGAVGAPSGGAGARGRIGAPEGPRRGGSSATGSDGGPDGAERRG